MNPNFDFRDDSVWDDRNIDTSVGDDFADLVSMVCLVLFLVCCVWM